MVNLAGMLMIQVELFVVVGALQTVLVLSGLTALLQYCSILFSSGQNRLCVFCCVASEL